ncbi:MAG: hypothetical protein CVU81_03190, partial [Euryarchaeota archaeon HGW-Euryarchaeota-1]
MTTITEGKAKIDIQISDIPSKKMEVFYNPRMEHNRTISIQFYDFWAREIEKSENLVFIDGMAASGIKGIRVLTETDVNKVIFNDINPKSIDNIRINVKNSKLPKNKTFELLSMSFQQLLTQKYENIFSNALKLPPAPLDTPKQQYIVDLDPFGSPVPYLDFVLANVQQNTLI